MGFAGKLTKAVSKTGVLAVSWRRRSRSSWLEAFLGDRIYVPGRSPQDDVIDARAQATEAQGSLPLWEGYGPAGHQVRSSDEVRTNRNMGRLYSRLTRLRRPDVVVEFGTAFGVSGMYWLDGLCAAGCGELLTFEPNAAWRALAQANLAAIGPRFRSIEGTFEDHIDAALDGRTIDVAFIDAIHTSEFVEPQFQKVVERLSGRGLVVLDDINFSDDMRGCWERLAADRRVCASASISTRVGIVELG